jgi:DNA repair protein RecN (Recombination protein N)
MLLELGLENFILFESVSFSLSSGFTVLTGETGAGKSLLVQALKLILGARADLQQIRTGAQQALVQAVFEVSSEVRGQLEDMGISCDDELIIRRTVTRTGKGRIYVNGAIVSLQDLRQIVSGLASLAGQHEYQELLSREKHCLWLDRFSGLGHEVDQIATLYQKIRGLQKDLQSAMAAKEDVAEEKDRLRQEAEEIDRIAPKPGEEERLEQELKVLKASEALRTLGDNCYRTLYADKGSVQEKLAICRQDLKRMADFDPALEKTVKELDSLVYQAEEVMFTIRDYIHGLPTDLSQLEKIEERIYSLRQLKRRFGPTIKDALAYRNDIEIKLSTLYESDDRTENLKIRLVEEEKKLVNDALDLSKKRRHGAKRLSRAIKAELSDLKLTKTDFLIDVEAAERPTVKDVGPMGLDKVQFLFSPNVGHPLRPLASIASGGELSRVMLALRAALARQAGIETIVFDEIDAGIGGEVAEKVGLKLKALSSFGQVVTITHFPQIAARGDHHIALEKVVKGDKTAIVIRKVAGNQRLEELTRMLGGDRETAKAYAGKLLAGSKVKDPKFMDSGVQGSPKI